MKHYIAILPVKLEMAAQLDTPPENRYICSFLGYSAVKLLASIGLLAYTHPV